MSKDMLGPAVRKLVALPSDTLGTVLDLLEKMADPSWRDAVKRFLRKEQVVWRSFLRPVGETELLQTGLFAPEKTYKTRKGLWVSERFEALILSVAKETNLLPWTKIGSFDLTKNATDNEIRSELPENYAFEASEFCGYLEMMMRWQHNGEKGHLLTNRRHNLFYVCGVAGKTFAVVVYWSASDREWNVDADPLDVNQWSVGTRVFSRNC